MPSDRKPSTDQVLTNASIGLGCLARWVSRSAIWMPLMPAFLASRPHSSRVFGSLNLRPMSPATLSSACLTNQDTMPGLAPQQDTAVVPVIILVDGLMDEADAALVHQVAVLVLGVDDDDAGLVVGEMALDQRQGAFADRAKPDHHNGAVDAGVK